MQDTRIDILTDWLDKQTLDSSITDGTIWHNLALSKRTFYRLKPQALLLQQNRAESRRKLIERAKTQQTIEAAKKAVLAEIEVDAKLSSIISGTFENIRKVPVWNKKKEAYELITIVEPPSANEVTSAADKMYKRLGSYAPEKHENTNINTDTGSLTEEQITALIDKL